MTTLHLGLIGLEPTDRIDLVRALNAPGTVWTTDGDSFLVWGEGRGAVPHDNTLHVLIIGLDDEADVDIEKARNDLARVVVLHCWGSNVRLIDYAVLTDDEDWAECQRVWLLDGTTTPKENS